MTSFDEHLQAYQEIGASYNDFVSESLRSVSKSHQPKVFISLKLLCIANFGNNEGLVSQHNYCVALLTLHMSLAG